MADEQQQLTALLRELDAAYSFGSHRDPPEQDDQQQQLWMQQLRFANMLHLPEAERRLLSLCKLSAERTRAAAVRKDFSQAWAELARSESCWRVAGIAEETSLLGQVESTAAQAVVEYQSGEYSLSRAMLQKASHFDQQLSKQFSSPYASVHAVHLLGKLVQLEAAQGHFSPALAAAAAALLVLSGTPATIDSTQWIPDPSLLTHVPPSILHLLSRQVVVEVGAALLFASPAQAQCALDLFYNKVGQAISGPHLDQMTQQWFYAKQLSFRPSSTYSAGHAPAEEHLQRCTNFLINSRRSAETLWLLGALDAAQRCAGIDNSAAREFRARAFQDLAVHSAFPSRLRTCWSRLADLSSPTSLPPNPTPKSIRK